MALFETNQAEVDSFVKNLYSDFELTSNSRILSWDEEICHDYKCVEKKNTSKIIKRIVRPIETNGLKCKKLDLIAQF